MIDFTNCEVNKFKYYGGKNGGKNLRTDTNIQIIVYPNIYHAIFLKLLD